MGKIIGIDLGTNSIGWAIREIDNELENQIVAKGVLTFEKGVATKEGKEFPLVQKRTESRGKRRNYQAEKYRKWELLECLINANMCPLTIDGLNAWRHYTKGFGRKYPQQPEFINWLRFDFDGDGKPDFERYGLSKHDNCYTFRWLAISDKEEHKKYFIENKQLLGRVFYQLVQRRGFFNNGNAEETRLIEEGRKNQQSKTIEVVGIKLIDQLIKEKYNTLGAALYWGQKNNELEAINHNRIRNRFTYRDYFEKEIDTIFKNLGYDLQSSFCQKIKKAITWQRPLRSQKGLVGYCTLDRPLKSKTGIYYKPGKKRIPLSHPLYEEFRTWVDINNLKIEPPEGIDRIAFLEKTVFPMFNKATDFFYSSKEDKKGNKVKGLKQKIEEAGGTILSKFDIESDEENEGKKYRANILLNKIEKIFGNGWQVLLRWDETLASEEKTGNYLRVEDIWHLIFDATITKHQTTDLGDVLIPILLRHFPDINFDKKDFDNIRLSNGYGSLSAATIKTILPYLKKGMLYSHAIFVANIENIFGKQIDKATSEQLRKEYASILTKHKADKEVYSIVNSLISDRMNERDRLNMGDNYTLDELDVKDIHQKIKDNFRSKFWNKKTSAEQDQFIKTVSSLYENYLRQPLGMDKAKQFFKLYRIEEKIYELLRDKYQIPEERINKYLWHPSEQEVYQPAGFKADKDGVVYTDDYGKEILFLGDPNPISKGFKNPMAMKTLQYLKKLLNYLLQEKKIDSNTKIVVEIARELNDTNTRKAIKRYQGDRATLRDKYKKLLTEYFNEAGDTNKNISPEMIDRYELWEEQTKKCIYCGKTIECNDLLNGTAQIEHTIPEGISQCSELFNLTIAHPHCNTAKAKRFPTQWTENYELIQHNIKFIYARYMSYKEKHEATYTGAKKAVTKDSKDRQIQDRHYYKMHLTYWKKKYETFTIEEVTNQFRRQQLTDTQIITKYALPYLKTVFKRVEPQKGIITADFRKIYKIQERFEGKERTKHSHHAIDAAVLTLIPPPSIRDFIRKEFYEAKEKNLPYHCKPKNWDGFHQQYILSIEDEVLNNYQAQYRTLTPTIKKIRKRGEIQKFTNNSGDKVIRFAKGDTIRGQLHQESMFGAILKPLYDENDKAINKNGVFLHEEKVSFVKRNHLEINTLRGFKYDKKENNIESFLNQFAYIIDPYVKKIVIKNIKERLAKGIAIEQVFVEPIFMVDKNGNNIHQIRRVRVSQGNINPPEIKKIQGEEGIYLSKHKHKQFVYAANTDYVSMICYKGFNENKKEKYHFKPFTALGLSKCKFIPKTEFQDGVNYNLFWELKPGMRIIVKQIHDEDLKKLSNTQLIKRLYQVSTVYPAYQGKYEYFYADINFHLNVVSSEIKNGKRGKNINFEIPKDTPLVRLNLAKSSFLIENHHFEIKPDGTILWK